MCRAVVVAALLVAGGVSLAACAPAPKSVPCSNDGECAAKGDEFAFCLESRCVECVGRGSCRGHPCVDGVCRIPCDDARDCPDGQVCGAEEVCARP